MPKEPFLIIKRRFTNRILESGLLILAVAGVPRVNLPDWIERHHHMLV